MADVFRVQGEIASRVAEAMRLTLGVADQARLVEVPTRDPVAYDAFLRAEAMFASGGDVGRRAAANHRRVRAGGEARYRRSRTPGLDSPGRERCCTRTACRPRRSDDRPARRRTGRSGSHRRAR